MNYTSVPLALTVFVEDRYLEQLGAIASEDVASIDWQHWFQTWLELLRPQLASNNAYELSLRLTGDREIATFNCQYRHQDKPTDVLAFAALETDVPPITDADEPLYLGDIVISLDTAIAQAKAQKHSLKIELAWLASHGLLHLLGWDHPDAASLEQMLARQSDLLSGIALAMTEV